MSKYSRGADFERAVVKHLENRGYLAFRCAGSKGNSKVDVVAFAPKPKFYFSGKNFYPIFGCDGGNILIQCKLSGVISKSEQETLNNAAKRFDCIPILASKINGSLHLDVIKEGDIKK